MNYMVIHEELKAGGWKTIVPDLPGCRATGVKFETRRRSAERSIRKYVASLKKAGKCLPMDSTKTVRLKRTVTRCIVHFVKINSLVEPKLRGTD
jgi:predicted RNase H-like HicB family nuclease